MRIKTVQAIIWLTGLIYLLFCIKTLTDSNGLKAVEYTLRGMIFICCLKYITQYQNKLVPVYFAYFSFFIVYFALGIFYGNSLSYLISDLMLFSLLIFIFFLVNENRDEFTFQLVDSISLIFIFGLVFSIYFFITSGLQPAQSLEGRLDFDSDDWGDYYKYALSIIQVSVLLLPFIWHLNFKRRFIMVSAITLFFIVSAFTLSRANIVAVLASGLITMYIGYKQNFIRLTFFTFSVTATGIIGLLTLFYVYGDIINTLYSLASLRFQEFGGDSIEPRDIEAEVYFANASLYELIAGKGFGGVNNYPFGKYSERGIAMLHRGENNLILKGGIILLVLLYGLALVALTKLLRSKAIYSKQWAAVIFIFLLLERGHQQYNQFFMLFFFCLAISYGLNIKMGLGRYRQA